jgi:hypothetical protein
LAKKTKEQPRTARIRVLITLDSADYERSRRIADEDGRSFSSWVRQLIKRELRRAENGDG